MRESRINTIKTQVDEFPIACEPNLLNRINSRLAA